MPNAADSRATAGVLMAIWAAGYTATFLGFFTVIFDVDTLRNRWVFRIILVLATCGTAVSVLGVLRLLGARMPPSVPFTGEADTLSFAAYLNVVLYAVLFLWVVNRGFADAAERLVAFVTGFKPIARARKAEKAGDYVRAIRFYQKHIEAAADDLEAMRHYATCLVRAGRFKEALAVFGEVTKRARGLNALTAGVEVVYVLQQCLADKAAAENQIDKLRKQYAATPFERELEARLEALVSRDAQ